MMHLGGRSVRTTRGLGVCRKPVAGLVLLVVCWLVWSAWWPERWAHRPATVNLVVVEEHHEVLPYWFQAVTDHKLPASGNTLLHVDGHIDLGAPDTSSDGYPMFNWPKTQKDIHRMMQSNDIFIQAAIMSGMFSRFIWVWPSWDAHNKIEPNFTIAIGWYERDPSRQDRVLCECQVFEFSGQRRCFYMNYTSESSHEQINVPPERCAIVRQCEVETISDRDALTRIRTGSDWIRPSETVLLDMDHDYFGCESGVQPLIEGGLFTERILKLDGLCSAFLCPKHCGQERLGDKLLKDIIAAILVNCRYDSHNKCSSSLDVVEQLMVQLLKQVHEVEPSLFCHKTYGNVVKSCKPLLANLYDMKPVSLRALLDVGFCLTTTPATWNFLKHGVGAFQVCHGYNFPDDSVVTLHSPTETEITSRMEDLRLILESVPSSSVRLVTLCRSMRDGYTPKKYFAQIERGLLHTVEQTLRTRHHTIVYDVNLLQGPEGLPSAYRPKV